MNGASAVQELEQIFKHKSLNDIFISNDGGVRARFPTDSSRLMKELMRSKKQEPLLLRPVIPEPNIDCSRKYTSKTITIRKRFIPAAQKVVERCLISGVVGNDVLSAVQGLARVIVATCTHRRASNFKGDSISPLARPKSWNITPSPEPKDHSRPRGFSASPALSTQSNEDFDTPNKGSMDDVRTNSRKSSRESLGSNNGCLDSLRRTSINMLDPLITKLTNIGSEKLGRDLFEEVIHVTKVLCDSINYDLDTEINEEDKVLLNVAEEVFTSKREETIEIVRAHFAGGRTEVTLPTITRQGYTRRSRSCIVKKQPAPMRRSLSDAKRYLSKLGSSTERKPVASVASSQETVRDSVISNGSSTSSTGSYDDDGLILQAKNMPRYQKKKLKAALAQTTIPTGVSMKRRTSSTITRDEAIMLGVNMCQIRRSAIGEESEGSDYEASPNRSWRDSGIDTISSNFTAFHTSQSDYEEDETPTQRPLSDFGTNLSGYDLSSGDEFLSIEVSGELGGPLSKTKKTLGQSPNNMGRYFKINVKTNIDQLQLQSYVIFKRFKDVITLYEDIEKLCPDGVAELEKPDRSIFNKKQNKLQVERLLLSVASNNKLRTLEPVINFLKPDYLPSEEASVPKTPQCNTPPSSDTVNSPSNDSSRHHPDSSATQQKEEIAEFYTPNISSGPPGTDHAPQPRHFNGSGGESPSIVRKTFMNMINQKRTVDEKNLDEREFNPVIVKDTETGEPLLLMTWSVEKKEYQVEGGRLDQLVLQLYSGNHRDAEYIQTFLLGYKQIMQPEELMDMLIKQFEDSQDSEEKESDMVKLLLSNIVTQWLERVWVDFHYNEKMTEKLDKFIQLVSSGHPQFLPVAMKLENTAQKKRNEWDLSLKVDGIENTGTGSEPGSAPNSPPQSPTVIRRSNSDTKNSTLKSQKRSKPIQFSDITTAQFARHIHCVDFDLMAKVELHEYFTYFCRKKDPRYHLLVQHLDQWITHWNTVSSWVTSEILRDETPKQRAAKIERLIDIAKQLKQLFSFNMLYAFITGFNNSSVRRLRRTWDQVSSRAQNSLADLEDLMSQDRSFSAYRKHLNKVPRTVCSIPLLSLILRDIEFLNVNSPKLKNGLWNFGKLRLIKNKISELERYKLIKPQLQIQPDDHILQYCRNLQTIPTAQFYDISMEREPRETPTTNTANNSNPRPISVSSLSSIATSSSS